MAQDVRMVTPIQTVKPITEGEHARKLELMAKKSALEVTIAEALAINNPWIEIEDDLLSSLCGGKLPEADYMWYKNVRLCRQGRASDIAKKENQTIFEVLFPKDGITYAKKV